MQLPLIEKAKSGGRTAWGVARAELIKSIRIFYAQGPKIIYLSTHVIYCVLMFGFGNFIFYSVFWIICLLAIGWNTRCLSICQLWFYFLFILQSKQPETFVCCISAAVLGPIPLTISLVLQVGLSDIFTWSLEPVAYLE